MQREGAAAIGLALDAHEAAVAAHRVIDDREAKAGALRAAAEQAIENLLANAMKYSGDAKQIEIEARRVNGHIVISVTDQGIGISRREQSRIFRKFYRVQRELGGGPQGTGLGLAIVDHTMRGHGGYVRVESEPERGSTFSLYFPIPSENAFQGTLAESIR